MKAKQRIFLLTVVLMLGVSAGCARSLQRELPAAPVPAAELAGGSGVDLQIPQPTDGIDLPPVDAPTDGTGGDAAAGDGSGTDSAESPTDQSPQPTDSSGDATTGADDGGTATTPDQPQENVIHVVKSGDILGFIAESYGVTVQDIIAANNLVSPDRLEVGQELLIPLAGLDSIDTGADDGATADPGGSSSANDIIHVVQPGETLFRIGLRYGYSYQELAAYNGIADPTRIEVGQQIRIPNN